jgi:transposase
LKSPTSSFFFVLSKYFDNVKNWLFAGSFEGARRAAVLYSLVQSCKLIDVPPFNYLKDVLLRVATHPQRLISELTPKGWATSFRQPAVA